MENSKSKNVIVTGANRGLGLGITKLFLEYNHSVTATARDLKKAESLGRLLEQYPDKLKILSLDISDSQSVADFSDQINEFDILLNNAGVFTGQGSTEESAEDIAKAFNINTIGSYLVTRALAKKASGKGAVIAHMSSLMGSISDNSSGGHYGYRLSKAALNMLTKNFAIENQSLVSLALHPGWVQTDMGGSSAPLSVEESAKGLVKILTTVGLSKSGKFLDYSGRELAW